MSRVRALGNLSRNLNIDVALALTTESMPETKRVVIGLTGRAGAGKDTVADYLVRSWDFEKVSFAQPIKSAVASLFGVSSETMEDRDLKEAPLEKWGKSPRELAQWLGTEVIRKQIDVDFFLKRMDISIGYSDRVVITDCRFDNEGEYVKQKWGGTVWEIRAPSRAQAGMSASAAMHSSERGLSPGIVTHTIDNDGGLLETFDQVDNHLLSLL